MQRLDHAVGVSIDGYAVEGGFDTDGGPATSFGVAQALGRVRPSLRSPGTFEHLPDVVARIGELGATEVRLTMEWARLEPRPGANDLHALDVYDAAIRAAEHAGLSVVVVLCDAAWPSWLGQEPWLSSWAPERFAAHAAWLGTRLEGRVRAIVTFRAPNEAARRGWRDASRPPFRRGAFADAWSALDAMFVAHQLAAESLSRAAPTTPRAILLAASRDYGDEAEFRDLASGIADASAREESAERFSRRLASHRIEAGPPRRWHARGRVDVATLRSTTRWASTPPCAWWLGADDLQLLGASLEHAAGAVDTVELGAGERGWATQLSEASSVLASPGTVHLCGVLSSSGPLDRPLGLLAVDQRDGRWTIGGPSPQVERALGSFV